MSRNPFNDAVTSFHRKLAAPDADVAVILYRLWFGHASFGAGLVAEIQSSNHISIERHVGDHTVLTLRSILERARHRSQDDFLSNQLFNDVQSLLLQAQQRERQWAPEGRVFKSIAATLEWIMFTILPGMPPDWEVTKNILTLETYLNYKDPNLGRYALAA